MSFYDNSQAPPSSVIIDPTTTPVPPPHVPASAPPPPTAVYNHVFQPAARTQQHQRTMSSGGYGMGTVYNPTNSVYYYDDITMPFFSDERSRHPNPAVPPPHPPQLVFHGVLQAPTAITQKTDDVATTYLNRGQWYVIELNDPKQHGVAVSSTVAIMFHEPSHRRVANNYWKFWLSQQKEPHARAIDLDSVQSTGISNVQRPDFDRISFEWRGNARIYVRFNCLSTDFSRIKGVKGIPLRVQLEHSTSKHQPPERALCKVKLFRDKGAERKNKDDAKQVGKQIERMPGSQIMYNQPMPYSLFTADTSDAPSAMMAFQRHSRTMTAPPTVHHHHQQHVDPAASSPPPAMLLEKSWPDLAHDFLSYHAVGPPPPPLSALPHHPLYPPTTSPQKRIRGASASPPSALGDSKRPHPVRTLYVQVSGDEALRPVELHAMTAQELTLRLCKAMSLCTDTVTEVVWRRKEGTELLVLVDDAVVNYQLYDNLKLAVAYQLKADGSTRIILDH